MALTLCSDLSAADWLTAGDEPWHRLVTLGPGGFAAYARLRFLPDPAYDGQSETDVELGPDAPSETAQLRVVLDVLRRFTRTPDDCYFCLWDGWGLHAAASKVVVPNRKYWLFRGGVTDLGERGSSTRWAGQPDPGADPAFIWPADHAWCIADDVDPHFAGIGAADAAVNALVADPRVDVVRADPLEQQPFYH